MNNLCNEILLDTKFTTITGATLVDDKPWYQIICTLDIARWLRAQDSDQWCELPSYRARALFDISEPLYLIMGMKW